MPYIHTEKLLSIMTLSDPLERRSSYPVDSRQDQFSSCLFSERFLHSFINDIASP